MILLYLSVNAPLTARYACAEWPKLSVMLGLLLSDQAMMLLGMSCHCIRATKSMRASWCENTRDLLCICSVVTPVAFATAANVFSAIVIA